MSTEVKVPTLGESVTEATIGEWLKQPGEAVALDEPIASLETDKVAVEVPSPVAGVMGQQVVAVGDTVNVGAVIATIEAGDGPFALVHLALPGGDRLTASLTRLAVDTLRLQPGEPIHALVKAVALDERSLAGFRHGP